MWWYEYFSHWIHYISSPEYEQNDRGMSYIHSRAEKRPVCLIGSQPYVLLTPPSPPKIHQILMDLGQEKSKSIQFWWIWVLGGGGSSFSKKTQLFRGFEGEKTKHPKSQNPPHPLPPKKNNGFGIFEKKKNKSTMYRYFYPKSPKSELGDFASFGFSEIPW